MYKFLSSLLIFFISHLMYAQTATFTYQATGGNLCNPSTINFTPNTSEVPIGYTWTFGNGQSSNAANPSVTYTAAGTYTVKLVAVFSNAAVESSQTITINQNITAAVTVDRDYICKPGNVTFTASSSGTITSYEWNFGDGTTITNTSASITHNYAALGNYNATVKLTDASGCAATASQNIKVQNPTITGNVGPSNGCIPINVNFTATPVLPIGGSVTSYVWDFNDGSPTSATNNHTYTTVGTFTPTVSIVTNEGCTNTFTYPVIGYGTPPTNHIAYSDKPVYCGSETPVFVAKANTANSYLWDFGDGTTQTVTDTITTHKYATLGPKSITVTPYFNGCPGNTLNLSVTIVGVIASFNYANTCTAKKTFSFTNTSQGNVTGYTWSFGDATANGTTPNVTHTYPTSGSFITKLTIADNVTSCTDNATVNIYTANPTLINPDTFLCRNANTTFTIQNDYQNPSKSYVWNVLGIPTLGNVSNPFTIAASVFGNFNTNFVAVNNGSQYCLDTVPLNHPISVRGPNLSFTAPTSVCSVTKFTVTNTSSPYLSIDTVRLWYWNYGINNTNDTIFQPKPIQYNGVTSYTIKLFAKDKNGCIDSLAKVITTKPTPFLRIFPRADTVCLGKTDSLIAFHSDTLLWSPASSVTCATCDTTIGTPTNTGYVFATATNNLNCVARDSTFILVYKPFTASVNANPVYVCINDSIQLNALPQDKKIIWSPNTDITNASIHNPFVNPKTNTLYTAALEDSAGCFKDTAYVNVIVKTLPTVNAGPDVGYPYLSPFTISPAYSANVQLYEWTPIGTLNCTDCPTPSGIADNAKTYTIKVTSDSGCVAKDDIKIFVECRYAYLFVPNAFAPKSERFRENTIFKPTTRGIRIISKFIIYNRYGQKEFEAKDFIPNSSSIGWNGKLNGEDQTPQAYVYYLSAICDSGETLEKKDAFILVR